MLSSCSDQRNPKHPSHHDHCQRDRYGDLASFEEIVDEGAYWIHAPKFRISFPEVQR